MSETFRTSIDIEATPERVFDHFVQPELLVRWMGDVARLEAKEGGLFSVDINGVLIRGEAGNGAMPPAATRICVTFEARGPITRVELTHSGLVPAEATKHAIGWPHFIERLGVAAAGRDPGPDPWKTEPPG
jgi:hypothetical protein